MFSADGNYISQDSKDIFEKYELIDLDSTPQGFGERETDFSPTYEWVKSRIKKTSKDKIIIHKKTCNKNSTNCIIKKVSSPKLEQTIRSDIIEKAALLVEDTKKKKK